MLPPVTAPTPVPNQAPTQTAQKTALPQADTARGSAGEKAAANIRAETTRAVDAPKQSAVALRLRDQETNERPETVFDDLAGPEPTFKESVLERQARTALDPPERDIALSETEPDSAPTEASVLTKSESTAETGSDTLPAQQVFEDPPPTPTQRAEVSFAETRILSEDPKPVTIDVAR